MKTQSRKAIPRKEDIYSKEGKMKHRHPGPKVRYRTKRNNIRFRKRPMHVQTLIFPKKKYNREKALKWAKRHGFQNYTSREEGDSIRVRQFPPSNVKRYGGTFPIGGDIKGVYAEVDKDKYKNMKFKYLKSKFNISNYGDDDGDKVPNYKDCRPWDKKRQDEEDVEQARRDYSKLKQEINDLDKEISKQMERQTMIYDALDKQVDYDNLSQADHEKIDEYQETINNVTNTISDLKIKQEIKQAAMGEIKLLWKEGFFHET